MTGTCRGLTDETPIPTRRRTAVLLSIVTLLLAASTACLPYEPIPRAQVFPFPGAHAQLTCAQCHGEGPPYYTFVWDTNCVSCHEADRKLHPGEHNPGMPCSADAGCHSDTDLVWLDALGGGDNTGTGTGFDHEFLPLEGGHDATTLGCTPCHEGTPSSLNVIYESPTGGSPNLCWSCHEDRRYTSTHYIYTASDGLPSDTELRRDCKACHDLTARSGGTAPFNADWKGYGLHGDIRFPHGMEGHGVVQSDAYWVTDCADCHPASPPAYVCTVACHDDIFSAPIPQHSGFTPGSNDTSCTGSGCHPYADIRHL